MKKLFLLLTFLLLIPFTASANTPSSNIIAVPQQGFYNYNWLTDLSIIQKDKVLQFVAENNPENIYFSETDSTKDTNVFYLFAEEKLIGGISQYKNESDYQEAHQALLSLFGAPARENTKKGYASWSFGDTVIISDKSTPEPSISFYYIADLVISNPSEN